MELKKNHILQLNITIDYDDIHKNYTKSGDLLYDNNSGKKLDMNNEIKELCKAVDDKENNMKVYIRLRGRLSEKDNILEDKCKVSHFIDENNNPQRWISSYWTVTIDRK